MTLPQPRPHRTRRVAAIGLVGCALVAAGCGSRPDPLEIGLKRVALDLAFRDATKADPVDAPRVIRTIIDEEFDFIPLPRDFEIEGEQEEEEPAPRPRRSLPPPPPLPKAPPCEVGDLGVAPQRNAFAVVKDPPKVGAYPRHNTGSISISLGGGAREIGKLAYPPRTTWLIPRVEFKRDSVVLAPEEEKTVSGLKPPPEVANADAAFPKVVEYELRRMLTARDGTIDTFQYTPPGATGGSFLYLVKRVTIVGGEETVFEPTPPIRYIELNVPEGPDSAVSHAGSDRKTNVAMSVQSQVLNRELVDVCGETVDTFRVQISESTVDLSGNEPKRGGNPPDAPTFWNIVFDDGLLLVREEGHTVRQASFPDPVSGQRVPVDIRFDFVSTLDDLEPKPLPSPGGSTPTTRPDAAGGEDEE